MGLTISDGIIDFLKEAANVSFENKSLLMLGYQHMYITYAQLFRIADRLDITLCDDFNFCQTIDVDAKDFFRLLGFNNIHVMDISDYEGADIVCDLNNPVDASLHNQFDYIIDGGTLEHVFNIPAALNNISKMLKIGGKVYHYLPAASYINHGFYSVSPSLFTDYYRTNGGQVEECNIILWSKEYEHNMHTHKMIDNLEDCLSAGIDYRIMDVFDGRFDKLGSYKGTLRCIATKREAVSEYKTPIQRLWYDYHCRYHAMYRALQIQRYNEGEIVVWGMGDIARQLIKIFEAEPDYSKSKILGFTATECKATSFEGYSVIKSSEVKDQRVKLVIIATTSFADEIYEKIRYLEKSGIRVVKINYYI